MAADDDEPLRDLNRSSGMVAWWAFVVGVIVVVVSTVLVVVFLTG